MGGDNVSQVEQKISNVRSSGKTTRVFIVTTVFMQTVEFSRKKIHSDSEMHGFGASLDGVGEIEEMLTSKKKTSNNSFSHEIGEGCYVTGMECG